MFIFQLIFFIVLLFVFSFLLFWSWNIFSSKLPFAPIPGSTLKDIDSVLSLKENSIVYNLVCGDARILFYLAKKNKNKNIKYVGIDNSSFSFFISSFLSFWHKKFNGIDVKIIKKDFFDVDLSEATHIVTYLFPNIMDDMLPKLDKEVKSGTRLVSVSFHFTGKREVEEIDLKKSKYHFARKIYVYEF